MYRGLLKLTAALLFGAGLAILHPISAEEPAAPAKPALPPLAADATTPMKPLERVAKSPKGTLRNPYTDNAEAIEQGKKLFFGKSCNGCHGGGGGGGMCPPLTNTVWVYGDDDDTLFRLISLGSQELQKQGYSRKGTEGVVGPMPPFGELIDKDQEVFKILAWIRTLFAGGPERRHW
jgi:mono/diheme cytochrome c family protein